MPKFIDITKTVGFFFKMYILSLQVHEWKIDRDKLSEVSPKTFAIYITMNPPQWWFYDYADPYLASKNAS